MEIYMENEQKIPPALETVREQAVIPNSDQNKRALRTVSGLEHTLIGLGIDWFGNRREALSITACRIANPDITPKKIAERVHLPVENVVELLNLGYESHLKAAFIYGLQRKNGHLSPVDAIRALGSFVRFLIKELRNCN